MLSNFEDYHLPQHPDGKDPRYMLDYPALQLPLVAASGQAPPDLSEEDHFMHSDEGFQMEQNFI